MKYLYTGFIIFFIMSDAWKVFGITIITFLVIISAILLFFYISRECNTNLDCDDSEYCAYNHKCYTYLAGDVMPANILPAAFVVGIALVIAAFILKGHSGKK